MIFQKSGPEKGRTAYETLTKAVGSEASNVAEYIVAMRQIHFVGKVPAGDIPTLDPETKAKLRQSGLAIRDFL